MDVTKGRAVDHTGQLELTFFNQSYVRRDLHPGQAYVFYGQVTVHGTRRQMTNPLFEPEGKWVQIGGIVPVYPLTAGLSQNFLRTLLGRSTSSSARRRRIAPSTAPPPGRTCKRPAAG